MHTNFHSLLFLLIFSFYFSFLLSASAIPATRTQILEGQDAALPSLAKLEHVLEVGNDGVEIEIEMEKGLIERRMNLETQDYAGTGANGDHDPKSPGT
ncbi:hypothetical protein VNO77_16851 [Canavalia gladiata]|uniref:Uncharacterized protein n=1 Tax=Canavalia gladiata TaxID=3824 RepID=A0AAN9LI16_CANGL